MADELFDGVLGGEQEKSEAAAAEAPSGPDAFAAAVAARLSSNDPEVARDTSAFLRSQKQLIDLQAQHLRDEHQLRLTHLAHQSHLLIGQRLGQAIRLAFQVVIALVVIAIGIGIAVMLHDAFTSHSVVIDAFNAPSALAPRGVTGTVVAGDVLNELTRLQNATRGSGFDREKRSLSNAWSNDVKIDVPETGISLGEISQLLKARFGHDLHIGGSLVESGSGGLVLTVSGEELAPKVFAGGADDLGQLVVDAAQYAYAEFQPTLWAHYLVEAGRCPESIAFIKSAYTHVDNRRRASLLSDWALCEVDVAPPPDSLREAVALGREAVKLDPASWGVYGLEQMALVDLGDEEGAWRVGEVLRRSTGARLARSGAPGEYRLGPLYELTGDWQAALEEYAADAAENGGVGSTIVGSDSTPIAQIELQLHDPAAAALTLQTLPEGDQVPVMSARVHFVRGLLAAELGDVTRAATEMEASSAVLANPRLVIESGMSNGPCELARAEEAAGHPDKADAALRGGEHFVDCQRFRGDILDHRGDWSAAQQAYAQAVALAPDLPQGYYSWGVALARHGDLAGALAKLRAANQRGPHWADPLKAWGDVLAKQGHWSDALARYDQALKYAPNWTALKQARATAAVKTKT